MMLSLYFVLGIALSAITLLLRNKLLSRIIIYVFLIVQTLMNIYAIIHQGESELEYFLFDNTAILFLSVLTLLSYYTVFYSLIYLKRNRDNGLRVALYISALMMLIVSVSGVYLAQHAGLLWVLVEATTLCVSLLIYHERHALSLEATWKYVFICSIGVALAFVGILFLGIAVEQHGTYDLTFTSIATQAAAMSPFWLKMSFLFILVGFSTKLGLFPLQTIKVDALTVAPSPVGAFISVALMNAGFIALFRFFHAFSFADIGVWMSSILMWSGLFSVLIAAVYMLFVGNLKRLGAFSGLEHIGIVAIGLSIGGTAYYAVFLHLILHSLLKSGFFFHLGAVFNHFQTYKMSGIKDYFGKHPVSAFVLLMLLLFLGAVPPSGLFVSEFLIFKSLFVAGHHWEMIVLFILLTFIIFSFTRNALNMIFSKDDHAVEEKSNVVFLQILPIILLLLASIWLGYFPPQAFVQFIQNCFI